MGRYYWAVNFVLMIAPRIAIAIYGIEFMEMFYLKIICRSGGGIYFDVHH